MKNHIENSVKKIHIENHNNEVSLVVHIKNYNLNRFLGYSC